MTEEIDISEFKKADVLAVLYNSAKPVGLGFMHYNSKPMTREDAQKIIDQGITNFDYLHGRIMKIDISGDKIDPSCYDADNDQEGLALSAITALYVTEKVNPESVTSSHFKGLNESATELLEQIDEESQYFVREDGTQELKPGFGDFKEELSPILENIIKKTKN